MDPNTLNIYEITDKKLMTEMDNIKSKIEI